MRRHNTLRPERNQGQFHLATDKCIRDSSDWRAQLETFFVHSASSTSQLTSDLQNMLS